jgi:hypothetical protein
MTKSHALRLGSSWQIALLLVVALSAATTMTGPANAATGRASSPSAVAAQANYGHAGAYSGTYRGCPYYYFCAYSGEVYAGTKIEMYYCQYYYVPFNTTGSFVNNQTPGTVANGYGQNYNNIWNSGPAFSQRPVMEWQQVWYVRPC